MDGVLVAVGFAFAAALQPGPLQAFFLSQVALRGWRATLPAALSPLLSDGPIALVVLLVLTRLPHGMERLLQAAGGCLLLWFAFSSFREWRRTAKGPAPASGSAPRTLLQAAAVNLVNPGPYLGWSLVLGPLFLDALRHSRTSAALIVVAFYATMVVMLAATIIAFGVMRSLGPRVARTLLLVSALALAVLGAWQLLKGLGHIS